MSANTPTGSTLRSRSSACTWSRPREVEKLYFAEQPVTGATIEARAQGRPRIVDYSDQGRHLDGHSTMRRALEPGMVFAGPAVIEDPGTTIVIHPGQRVTIDRFGNIHIDSSRKDAAA